MWVLYLFSWILFLIHEKSFVPKTSRPTLTEILYPRLYESSFLLSQIWIYERNKHEPLTIFLWMIFPLPLLLSSDVVEAGGGDCPPLPRFWGRWRGMPSPPSINGIRAGAGRWISGHWDRSLLRSFNYATLPSFLYKQIIILNTFITYNLSSFMI